MSLKYSVITDNSQENREWLDNLGYKFNFVVSYVEFEIIYTWKSEMFFIDKIDVKNLEPSLFINCIGNPQLFKAVSAISTTTDIGKHYINNHTGQWRQCDYNMATDENIDWGDWTEATLSELINHFK